jgi:hypothetical protein
MGHDNVARPLSNEGGMPQDAQKGRQQGRSERRTEAYPLGYVEDLSDARTKLPAFFSILPERDW